jgi:MFS family permease
MEYLYTFSTSFWLLTGSCVLTYMSVFPYIQNCSDLLQKKYGFDKVMAGYLFGVPYIISAIASPFLGALIDRFGKRALLICLSSLILIIAFTSSMMMPECHQCYNEVYPLILTGIGYSIYASAIWGSVPYVVSENAVGTAFGLATSIQNIGLCTAPTIVGFIKDRTKSVDHGYFYMNAFFVVINLVGLILNDNLYYIDVYYNNSVLDKVDLVSSGDSSDASSEDADKRRGEAETNSMSGRTRNSH